MGFLNYFFKLFEKKIDLNRNNNIIKQKGNLITIGNKDLDLISINENLKIRNFFGEIKEKHQIYYYNGEVFLNNGIVISSSDKSFFSIKGKDDYSFVIHNHFKTIIFNIKTLEEHTTIIAGNIVIQVLKPKHI